MECNYLIDCGSSQSGQEVVPTSSASPSHSPRYILAIPRKAALGRDADRSEVEERQKAKGKGQKEAKMAYQQRDIVERTFQFAVAVVRLCRTCERRDGMSRILARQLLRSATSVGANVEEAQAGQSRADFVSKYAIALKEARETCYWLRLIIECGDYPADSGAAICQEAEELKRIIAAIIVKAKQNSAPK